MSREVDMYIENIAANVGGELWEIWSKNKLKIDRPVLLHGVEFIYSSDGVFLVSLLPKTYLNK